MYTNKPLKVHFRWSTVQSGRYSRLLQVFTYLYPILQVGLCKAICVCPFKASIVSIFTLFTCTAVSGASTWFSSTDLSTILSRITFTKHQTITLTELDAIKNKPFFFRIISKVPPPCFLMQQPKKNKQKKKSKFFNCFVSMNFLHHIWKELWKMCLTNSRGQY